MEARPDLSVRGILTAVVGEKPEARLTANLVPDPRVTIHEHPERNATVLTVSADAERAVESFLPVTIHGRLDSGDAVTLLEAQDHGAAGWFTPKYRATSAVVGACVSAEQLYSATRFRLDCPYWLAHLHDGDSCRVEDDGSELSVEADEDGNWLIYESAVPTSLRELEIRVISGCLALLQVALYPDDDRATRETQVRVGDADPWLSVYGPAFCAEPGDVEYETLLAPDQLTVERFATWIALHTRLDGLTWVVARHMTGAVQARVLLLMPLVEGFHRRLPFEQSKFPAASRSALNGIKRAARQAAATKARTSLNVDPEQVHKAVSDALSHLEDVDYLERARVLVTEVCTVVPEIAESLTYLPERMTKVRNELAHQLLPADEAEPLKIRALEWLVISNVAAWLLRALVLLRAGMDPQQLRERFLRFERFRFFRANTKQHVRELGWSLPT